MKKIIYLILIACSAIFLSCKEDSGMTKDGDIVLSNLTAEPRIGAVVLKWDNPSASDYYYATVTYNNASGEEVKQKVSVYSVDPDKGEGHTSVRIGGFSDTNTYEFTVTPYTSDERYGDAVTVSCTPEDASKAFKYITGTVEAKPTVEGAVISWANEYDVPVTMSISYKNLAGETKTVTRTSNEGGSVEIFPFVDKTNVTITATDESGKNTSEPKVVEVTPERGEIPQFRMTAIGASGVDGDNVPANLLDNNVSTAWSGSNNDIVWVAIDLGEIHRINWFELVGNSKDRDGQPVALMVFDSKEPVADMSQAHYLGMFEYNREHIYNHAYKLENPIDTRYILIAFPSVQRVSITEFCAYYADAATHYAKESELELQPDPDDDPTYYPEIEYMTPTATVNNLKFTQSNPDNPSEYTFETTGGDSWVHLAPLKKQAAGTVLVFQYKSTGNLRCEFFWIKPGAQRPAGGVETFFDIKKTDEWKTFKMNMANDWIKTDPNNGKFKWWDGVPGDFVRFDIGDGAGETVVVRLMHWRAAEDGE